MADATLKIDVLNFPEALHAMTSRLAFILREEADAEADPRIQRRLREIAARFEAGQ